MAINDSHHPEDGMAEYSVAEAEEQAPQPYQQGTRRRDRGDHPPRQAGRRVKAGISSTTGIKSNS
jgi:hypothetical protein